MRYLLIGLLLMSSCKMPKMALKSRETVELKPAKELALTFAVPEASNVIISMEVVKPMEYIMPSIKLSTISELQIQLPSGKHYIQEKQQMAKHLPKSIKAKFGINGSKLELKKVRINGPSQFDSRIEPMALDRKISWQNKILKNASSIGIIVEKDKIHSVTDTSVQLDINMTLRSRFKLCPEEAFANQPVIGIGTAFIIGTNKMVTASHVFTGPLDNYVVIFGFDILNTKGEFTSIISKKNIYHPKKVIYKENDADFLLFEVEGDCKRPVLILSKNKNPVLDTEIYMIGFPSGLPQKISLNAEVQENNHPQYFYTSLDAFQGNSGSPIFNMATHEVIGVLVSGEVDYIWNGGCNRSSLSRFPYSKGEKVMKLLNIEDYIDN